MRLLQAGQSPAIFLDETSVLDIGPCLVDGLNIAPERAIPDDGDPRIDHSLEGFLFTCGPDHIRHPQPIEGSSGGGNYPLHGSFSSHPATITDWSSSPSNAQATAQVPIKRADGGTSLLERRWLIDGTSGEVSLTDRVTNTGRETRPTFLMYHMNVAAKLFDDAVRLKSASFEDGDLSWRFGEEPGSVFCVAAAPADGWACVTLGPIAALGGRRLTVSFRTDTLPHLQMWRNQRSPADVLGIEPVSHRWVDRAELERAGEFVMLEPGDSRTYELRFSFSEASPN